MKNVISDFHNKGYTFDRMTELGIITKAIKKDISYDLYLKHIMHAVERKLLMMINKNKTIINKLNKSWRHLLSRKYSDITLINY